MLTKKVDMSVFVRNLVYEVRTAAQSIAGAIARAEEDASASVGAGAEAAAAAGDVDMEDPWYDFHPSMVHANSKELHLDICITKLNVDH